nr:DUF397 domain-containing protein [Streptomyces halstedii]
MVWFKSSYSSSSGDSCIEVALAPGAVHVRDSKIEQSPELALSSTSWAPFVSYAALG